MLKILIPLGSSSNFFKTEEYIFPKPLIEINGKMMIEWVVENLNGISDEKIFIFVVRESDCKAYYLDDVLKLVTNNRCEIIKVESDTQGAACSCLMAAPYIDDESPLLICNGDQIIQENLDGIFSSLSKTGNDAGVLCFKTSHPRWAFVRLDAKKKVVEASEKRPISQHAVAGMYYFAQGRDFVKGAMQLIRKDARVNERFYVAPVLNELVLEGKQIVSYNIKSTNYHTFYSPQKIKDFELRLKQCD